MKILIATIPKLLSGLTKSAVGEVHREIRQTLTKVYFRWSWKGFKRKMHHLHRCSYNNRPQGDTVLQRVVHSGPDIRSAEVHPN